MAVNEERRNTVENLEGTAKECKFDLSNLNLDYSVCSIPFLQSVTKLISKGKNVCRFIETCKILFPENPTDLSEDIAMAVLVIEKENTAVAVKQELDAEHCEMSMEGLVFESMYQKYSKMPDTIITRCGRLAYDDKYKRGIFEMDFFMSEGIKEARKIYSDVKHAYNCAHKELSDGQTMFGHLVHGYMLELTMDDMNIRGQQIIYGYEYANHSAEALAELISKRDKDLVAYINKRTVEEYDNVSNRYKNCLAVDGGASFDKKEPFNKMSAIWNQENVHTEYNPLIDDAEEIISECTKEHFGIDYASMDINLATSTEDGIKIAQAHGFEMVWSGAIKNDTKMRSILMVNKDRDALLYANARINDTMAYGGCSVYVVTNNKDVDCNSFSWRQLCQNSSVFKTGYQHEDNPYRNFQIRDCHYDEGCFKQYDFLKQAFPVRAEDIPWEAAPIDGLSGIPVPKTFEFSISYSETSNSLCSLLRVSDVNSLKYHIEGFINQVNFVRDVLPTFPQDVKDMYVRYEQNPYKTVAETLFYFDIGDVVNSTGIAFRYLDLPEDEELKYLSEIKNCMMEYVRRYNTDALSYAMEQFERIKGDTDTWDKALKVFLPSDEGDCIQKATCFC